MKKITYSLLLTLLFFACKNDQKEQPEETEETKPVTLEKTWEVKSPLEVPESVIYDKKNKRLLVTNVNENAWEMDGDGFITSLNLSGEIIEEKWLEELSSPKGMGIIEDTLYVADSEEIVKINIPEKQIIKRYKTEEKKPQLNDIAIRNNTVYISASNTEIIYKLENDSLSKLYKGNLGRPNGLFFKNDTTLLIANSSSKQLKSLNTNTKKVKTLVDNIGFGDGVTPYKNNTVLVSDWEGGIFHIDNQWHKTRLTDSREERINTADILYIPEHNLLIVPTFLDGRLVAYKLNDNNFIP